MKAFGMFGLVAILMCGSALAQETGFRNPTTGFMFDESVSGVRPIGGFPGAAMLGDPIGNVQQFKMLRFAPGQSCAIGVDADGRVYIVKASGLSASLLEDADSQPSAIQFNRAGSAAVLYFGGSKLQVVTGLPDRSSVSAPFEVPDLAGEASALALDNVGSRVAIGVTGQSRGAVYLVDVSSGKPPQLRFVASAGAPSALAFSENGKDLAIADKTANAVFAVKDLDGAAAALPIAGLDDGIAEPGALEFFDDTTLLITNSASADLFLARLAPDSSVALLKLRAPAATRRLDRLSSSRVYLLTPVSTAPLALLDMSETPVVFFIPAKGN